MLVNQVELYTFVDRHNRMILILAAAIYHFVIALVIYRSASALSLEDICICISLRKSFRKPQDSQSTQHRKAFIGIDQVAELVEIPFITKFSSITRPISETSLPLQPSLKAFQYFRIFSS